MPTTRVLSQPTTEPVSLALLAAHSRVDVDSALLAAFLADPTTQPPNTDAPLWAELDLMQLYVSSAREKVEAYTGRYFSAQQVAITYELGEGYLLPAGATALSVDGFFKTLADLEAFNMEEYRKGISINRQLPWGEAIRQTYTVTADVVADTQYFNLAKRAILEIAGEWYKNRETTADARGLSELPVSWRVTLAEARVTVLGE